MSCGAHPSWAERRSSCREPSRRAVPGVNSLKVSPDGNWVAFATAAPASGSQQLWRVANDGTAAAPVAVSGTQAGTGINDYQ